MRTQNLIKNIISSMSSYIILFLISLLLRRVFLNHLGVVYLGYESLFSNLFTIMATTEMGVGKNIAYHLYKAFSKKNEEDITELYNIYRCIYWCIGGVILIVGILCSFFFENIISGNELPVGYIRIIYYLQLFNILRTYFLSCPRMVFQSDQKEYIYVTFDSACNVSFNILKIISIILFQSYFLYLLLTIAGGLLSDFFIWKRYKKDYPYIKKQKITYDDLKKRNLFMDIGNFWGHQLAGTVFCGTDSIVISKMLGILQVGYYNNYLLIKNQLMAMFVRLFHPLQASIGNLVYSDDEEKRSDVFEMLNVFGFCAAIFIGTSTAAIIQPFISFVFGDTYLLSDTFVLILSANIFIEVIREIQSYFRFVFGEYEKDRKYVIQAAVLNLVLSVILSKNWGLEGILFATLLGNLLIWYGNLTFFKGRYIMKPVSAYIGQQIIYWVIGFTGGALVLFICKSIPFTLMGFFIRCIVCVVIPNSINYIVFRKTAAFYMAKEYFLRIKSMKQK